MLGMFTRDKGIKQRYFGLSLDNGNHNNCIIGCLTLTGIFGLQVPHLLNEEIGDLTSLIPLSPPILCNQSSPRAPFVKPRT